MSTSAEFQTLCQELLKMNEEVSAQYDVECEAKRNMSRLLLDIERKEKELAVSALELGWVSKEDAFSSRLRLPDGKVLDLRLAENRLIVEERRLIDLGTK
jgi:hypothetical protein